MIISRKNFLGISGLALLIAQFPLLASRKITETDLEERVETKEDWMKPRELDALYDTLAEDILSGKPIIISNYLGLWVDGKPPETNLYWGALYGHQTMFDRASIDKHSARNFENHDWVRVHENTSKNEPLETVVYQITINPNENWTRRGVNKPFTIFQVYQVFENIYQAGYEMFLNLKQDKARKIELDNNEILDLGNDSRIIGYIGHNFLMDGRINKEVDAIQKTTDKTKASFAIGCVTSSFFKHLTESEIFNLLYTTSFMAPEGYTSLALVDGIAKGSTGKEIAQQANTAYRYFQVLGRQKKPGTLFVNHSYNMFK